MFTHDRQQLRQMYYNTWQKLQNKGSLEQLEKQIADVIIQHPEYHRIIENPDLSESDFPPEFGETNPFLHMGLHLAIREQIATDRPHGITLLFKQLTQKLGNPLIAEHQMMDYLVEALWQAQRNNTVPDENQYLKNLRELI